MAAVKTSLTSKDLPDDLRRLRLEIEDAIPVGRMSHDAAAWQHAPDELRDTGQALMDRYAELDARVHHRHRRLPDGDAGRRQPLHRGLPGHGRHASG